MVQFEAIPAAKQLASTPNIERVIGVNAAIVISAGPARRRFKLMLEREPSTEACLGQADIQKNPVLDIGL